MALPVATDSDKLTAPELRSLMLHTTVAGELVVRPEETLTKAYHALRPGTNFCWGR